jgi:hypothetical protein
MKCKFVGRKYMHFMTASTPTLRVLLITEQKERIKSWDINKNSSAVIAQE